jgi:S-adenosylmethionine-diacylglycerol 3-amino-3-carboxypropyl transferase
MSEQASAVLIRRAVSSAHGDELARSNERFAQSFARLVYNQIWEDPVVDMEAMALTSEHRVMTICSAGCNALSYLTAGPAEVHAVDLNFAHLALADFKRSAIAHVPTHADLASLFVKGSGVRNLELYRKHIAGNLRPDTRAYWDGGSTPRVDAFATGLFRAGLLGVAVRSFNMLGRLYGVRFSDALALDDADQQRAWARTHVRPIFEGRVMSLLCSLRHPLYLLGIPPRQFQLLCDGDPKRMATVLAERVEQLAGAAKSSKNYFLWQACAQSYAQGPNPAVPPYLEPGNFEIVRSRLDRLRLTHDSFTSVLKRAEALSYDRYLLLDAQDWMDKATITDLWTHLTRTARPSARVVFRTAGSQPPFLEHGDSGAWTQWRRLHEVSDALHRRDRSGIYGGLHIYALAG